MRERYLFGMVMVVIYCMMTGCDKGIAPIEDSSATEIYGISGTIYFSNWPPVDSVIDLRLVAFVNYPPADIFSEVIQGRAKYTDRLPYAVDSVNYTLIINPLPPDTIRCIAVGQQYGANIEQDWRLVGIYYTPGDSVIPGRFYVPADSILSNINIAVDYKKLPHQP